MLGLIEPKLMDNIFSIILNKGDVNEIIKELETYEVSQVCDEMTIYLRDKMLSKDRRFDLLLFDRFFRILSDAKHLLSINSDGTFVLLLTFMKMIEATNLKSIDDIINQVEKIEVKKEQIVQKIVEKPVMEESSKKVEVSEEKPLFIEEETKIVEVSPFDEVLIQSNNIVDLQITDSIEVLDFSTPFDELPMQKVEEVNQVQETKVEEIKELEIETEPIFEEYTSINLTQEVEIIPLEDEIDDEKNELYERLTAKVYDRDFTLGECFEKNFIFNGFENNKLHIISYAQDEDRKLLYKHFGIIKTFAQDIFGNDVELDFKKEEPSVLEEESNNNLEEKTKEEEILDIEETSSMLESIEMGSGCVADMTKSSVILPSQKELELNDILNSKMLDKFKELFDIKKITVKARS